MQDNHSDEFIELGTSGLARTSGMVDQEWLRQLKGVRAYRTYTEMRDNDAVIGAILYAIETLVRQVEWKVNPSEDTEEARAAAEFLETCIIDMSVDWESFISEVLTMLPYGYSLFEVVYKLRGGSEQDDERYRSRYDDGRVGWRKFAIRGQDTIQRWCFSEEGAIEGAYQSAPPSYETILIPMDKCLLFRTKVERNNPEGKSLLRNAYRSWYFLKRLQEIEAIGVERDLAGLPVMHVPLEVMSPNATSAQRSLRSSLETVIQQIRRDEREGILMPAETDRDGNPTGYKLSLLSTGGSRAMDTDTIIKRYESRIAMSVLAEFIMLGMDGTGSFALADSKTSLFATSLRSILESVAAVLNTRAIPELFKLNPEFPERCYPELTYGDIETQDLEGLGKYVQSLASAGLITPDKGLEDTLRQAASLPLQAADTFGGTVDEYLNSPESGSGGGAAIPSKVDASTIDALMKVLRSVEDGTLSRQSAMEVLKITIPGMDPDHLAAMLPATEAE